MKHVTLIIPTDFSENARQAIDFAYQKIKRDRSEIEIKLMHSLPPLHGSFKVSLHLEEMRKKEANIQLQKELVYILQKYKDVPSAKVVEGDPEVLVKRFNQKENTYLVMSSKGESNIADKLLGSIAEKTIQHAEIPALILPNKPIEGFKNVCIAMDDPNKNLYPELDHLLQLDLADGQVDITGVYVQLKSEQIKLPKNVDYNGFHIKIQMESNDSVSQGLIEFIERQRVDLLCLQHKHRMFFHYLFNLSVSKKLLANLSVPILVLPH